MGDIMTIECFIEGVNGGGLTDYDGWGYFCNDKGEYAKESLPIIPSKLTQEMMNIQDYIIWYNK